jgi:hypothetical protein
VGLFKALKAVKEIKEVAAAGSADGQAAPGFGGVMMGFANVMAGLMAPIMLWMKPERGRPLPATEPAAAPVAAKAALSGGLSAIVARDSAFDPALLTAFADQVFASVVAVWSDNDPGPVRGVLADALWEPLAAAASANQSMAVGHGTNSITTLATMQQGRASLVSAHAGEWYDSVVVAFDVRLSDQAPAMMREPWTEEWLFQRSLVPGPDPMSLPDQCPTCGAPTAVDSTGACTRCREPIPLRTAGWLVSRIVCHNPMLEMEYDQLVAQLRQNPEQLARLPAPLRELLPRDLQAPGATPQ